MDFLGIRSLTPAIARRHFTALIKFHLEQSNRFGETALRIGHGGKNARRACELEAEMLNHGAYAIFLSAIAKVVADGFTAQIARLAMVEFTVYSGPKNDCPNLPII